MLLSVFVVKQRPYVVSDVSRKSARNRERSTNHRDKAEYELANKRKGDSGRDFCLGAKRSRCPRGWLWWCGLFTNMIYDVLPRRASARDSQCAHNVRHNLLILLMAPAHYYWFRTAPRSDGRWFIPVVIGPMLNRPRTRSRENTIRRLVYFSFPHCTPVL